MERLPRKRDVDSSGHQCGTRDQAYSQMAKEDIAVLGEALPRAAGH